MATRRPPATLPPEPKKIRERVSKYEALEVLGVLTVHEPAGPRYFPPAKAAAKAASAKAAPKAASRPAREADVGTRKPTLDAATRAWLKDMLRVMRAIERKQAALARRQLTLQVAIKRDDALLRAQVGVLREELRALRAELKAAKRSK